MFSFNQLACLEKDYKKKKKSYWYHGELLQ